jgi:predicted RNase H-like nuclease (RuvC/YqgF family)
MSSVAPIIMSVFGGGAVTGAVTAGRWVMDERARRKAEKAATVRAPLVQKSLELRVAAQADEILQETIKTLRENYAELKKDFARYRIDTDDLRSRDLKEHERQRTQDHKELERLRQEVDDQSATITQLKFELQHYRSAAGP